MFNLEIETLQNLLVPLFHNSYEGLREGLGDTVFQFLKIKVKFAFPLGIEGLAITFVVGGDQSSACWANIHRAASPCIGAWCTAECYS